MIILQLMGVAVLLTLAVPVSVLVAQVLLGSIGLKQRNASPSSLAPSVQRPRVAVLIPAHNEAAGLGATLDALAPQLGPSDRILVVADNCDDATAAVARAHSAEVTERYDALQRGKGYALDHGVRELTADPPDVVVVVDADCLVDVGALARLAATAMTSKRPVQALYLMQAPPGAGLRTRIAEFAWLVRNEVRPLGWHRLNWPCQLMGTGMAFPWTEISQASLATGHIVEDMQLGLDLAERGVPPMFCPEARVTSLFPSKDEALAAQRTRWEHGHMSMLLSRGPAQLLRAIRRVDIALAAMALDLCVPPLVSLLFLLSATCLVGLVALIAGGPPWFLIGSVMLYGCTLAAIALAWQCRGREVMALSDWLSLPRYVLGKLPIYFRFLTGKRQRAWVRTERDQEHGKR